MFKALRPAHFLSIGLIMMLFSSVGSSELIDGEATVPPNDYVHYTIRVYPGQSIQAAATVHKPNQAEYERNMLEILIMDEANFNHFQSEDYGLINERYRELVGSNYWEYLEVDTRWLGTIHVILNNKIRVSDRDIAKDVSVRITRFKPLGYLGFPGLITLIIGANLWVKKYRLREEEDRSTAKYFISSSSP